MPIDRQEQALLDEIEDADRELKFHRRLMRFIGGVGAFGTTLSVGGSIGLSLLHSIGVDMGEGSPWIVVIGIVFTVFAAIGLFTYLSEGDELKGDRTKLVQAQRAHRNYVTAKIEKELRDFNG